MDALEKRGLLFREDGVVAFDSPFLRVWVEREVLADVPPAAALAPPPRSTARSGGDEPRRPL